MIAAFVGALNTGCVTPSLMDISGLYSGTLTTQSAGGFQKTAVNSDIQAMHGQKASYSVKDGSGNQMIALSFEESSDDSIEFQSSLGFSPADAPVTLKLEQGSGCYTASSPVRVAFCASVPEITLEIDDAQGKALVSLILYPKDSLPAEFTSEKPQVFTLSQAIERAKTMSFQSRIEFEHLIQARGTAKAGYLHLLPQLTFNSAYNNIAPTVLSFVGSIADLAPFLLPSRWIQAWEADALSKAEQDSDRLMRLDMANQVEGLIYAYEQDRQSLAIYTSMADRVTPIVADVQKRESAGQLPVGSADAVQAALNDLTHNQDVYGQILTEDLSALSQALGFFDPLTVTDAQIDQEAFPIESAPSYDFATLNPTAIARSYELDQTGDLLDAARLAKNEEFFDWLDPVGDPSLGLGAALGAQVQVALAQINELSVDHDQLQSIVSQKALNAVTDYNQMLDNFSDSQSDVVLHEKRLSEMLAQLDSGAPIDAFDLCSVLADDLGARLSIEQARAGYRVARSEIDRMLLQGWYQNF